MAANPLAEKRRLRKLEQQQLEDEAKRRQEELRLAHELEQQRIKREQATEQQQQVLERERLRHAHQTELDRIAHLEQLERATVARIEASLCNIGSFVAGELLLPNCDAAAAHPLTIAVLTLSALEAPLTDAPATGIVVFVADASGHLHVFDLIARTRHFSATFIAPDGASVLQEPSAMCVTRSAHLIVCNQHRASCVFVDLRALFALATSAGDSLTLIDGSTAIAFVLGDCSRDATSALFASPRGVAFDDLARELFVSDQLQHRVAVYALTPDTPLKPRTNSSTKAPMTFARAFGSKGHGDAELQCPRSLATSLYHVVVCDTGNDRIVVFAKRGSFVCAIGRRGSSACEFHDIHDVALVHVRKRVQLRGAELDAHAVTTEAFEIVVADVGNFRVHVLNERGAFLRQLSLLGSIEQIASLRTLRHALQTDWLREFAAPALAGCSVDAHPSLCGNAIVSLYPLAHWLHPSSAAYVRVAATHAQWHDTSVQVHHPRAVAAAALSARELVVVDNENARVFVYNIDSSHVKWLGLGDALTQSVETQPQRVLMSIHSVVQIDNVDETSQSAYSRVFVSDPQSHRVAAFDAQSWQFLFYVGAATYGDAHLSAGGFLPGELQHPTFLASTTQRSTRLLVVSDSGNHRVSLFDAATGQFYSVVGNGYGHVDVGCFDSPQGVAVLDNRWLFVCDQRNHRVQVFDLDEVDKVQTFGCEGSAPGEFCFPTGLAVCADLPRSDVACDFGPHRDAKVVVSDTGNYRMQVFGAVDLRLLLVIDGHGAPLGERFEPNGVSVEHRSGCVLVVDVVSQCVLVFRRDGAFLASVGANVELAHRFKRPTAFTQHGAVLLVADAGRCDVSAFELCDH